MDGSVYFGGVSACGLSGLAAPVIFGSSPCCQRDCEQRQCRQEGDYWMIHRCSFTLSPLIIVFVLFFLHQPPPPRRIWRRRSHSILLEYVINRRQTSGFKPGWMMASLHHGFQALQLVLLNNYRSHQLFCVFENEIFFFKKSNKVFLDHLATLDILDNQNKVHSYKLL